MGLKASRPRSKLLHQDKKHPITSASELHQVAQSKEPFIQVQTYPPGASQPQQVFLDTSLQQILYGEPIGEESPSSNLSTVWIMTEPCTSTSARQYIISSVTTPIGQAQPSPDQTGDKTYDITVVPVSTNQEFVWTADLRDGKWALYIEQPGAPRLYALPVKSDNPGLTPPRDTLIKAVDVDPSTQDVYVFTFLWVDSVKYKPNMPSGIDVYLRPPPKCTM